MCLVSIPNFLAVESFLYGKSQHGQNFGLKSTVGPALAGHNSAVSLCAFLG